MKAAEVLVVLRYPEPTGAGNVVVETVVVGEPEAVSGAEGRLSENDELLPEDSL
jgi:hypothetical protein